MMNKSNGNRTAAFCAPKQQIICAANQTGLARYVVQTIFSNVGQIRPNLGMVRESDHTIYRPPLGGLRIVTQTEKSNVTQNRPDA